MPRRVHNPLPTMPGAHVLSRHLKRETGMISQTRPSSGSLFSVILGFGWLIREFLLWHGLEDSRKIDLDADSWQEEIFYYYKVALHNQCPKFIPRQASFRLSFYRFVRNGKICQPFVIFSRVVLAEMRPAALGTG